MFPLFLKIFSFPPSRLSRKVFTTFKVRGFSSYSSPPKVSVSVWWHIDSCPVPSGFSFSKVAPSITAAVRANGIMGTIRIRAYGDVVDKEALNSTNITLHSFFDDYPFPLHKTYTDTKNNTYKHFLADLNDWVSENPPPRHLFLIFGKEEFSSSGVLHRLRMCNYNILLACPGWAHVDALCHAATIMWEWSSMLNGDDLTGKHFNYPPDGPTNSCYENSNAPLENPFSVVELHTSSQNSEEISKPTLDIKSFSRQVMKILCSHPNGISIGDLRAELTKCDVPLVKRFYGNKKFSDFLISISYVELQYLGGDNFWVCLVPSTTSAVKNNQKDGATTQKVRNDGKNMDRSADGVPKISSSCVSSEGDDLKSFQSIPSQGKPLGEYADGKSSYFCSWISSWWTFLKSRASHFEEPKSSELQQDLSHPLQPHWDNFKFRVAVWWDFDSCGVPSGISFLNVAPSIMGVLRANRIKGPIHIDAYGDVSQLSQIKQEALFLSGIDLHHVPGGKNKNKCFVDWFS
ncbi:putative meiosis arrest female protein [Medicago truncatula]|uniref:NYN domain protein n=1 Tax=Medicago truncatula TaxID=3880 RepID=A0A072UR80_MEDTR|nr:uncharacterized protein LOC25493560 isoform X1 [Medicago truncatula]KEH31573.1 NYN domain protein [Medicago truncatula]RHN63146.1 putative meiosis arrest female protein [Medicago truncatula]